MTVDRKELISALKDCLPGIEAGGAVLEGADSFVFKKGYVHSFNDKISVSVKSPIEELDGTVKAKEFFSILSKLSGEEVKFSIKDDRWLMKCGSSKVELSLLTQEIYDRIVDSKVFADEDWKPLADDFEQSLSACKFGCNNSNLAGIFVSGKRMVSTDENRINWYSMGGEMDQFWINDPSAGELMKFTGFAEYRVDASWVHFRTVEGVLFSCRKLMDEKYPYSKIQGLMEKKYAKTKGDKVAGKLPADFIDGADRAGSFSTELNGFDSIEVELQKDAILMKSSRASGKYSEKIKLENPIGGDFDSIKFNIDPSMVKYGLSRATDFYVKEMDGRIFLIFHNDNFLHLVTTIRKDDEE